MNTQKDDRKQKELKLHPDEGCKAFLVLLEIVRQYNRPRLREIANIMKRGREDWGVVNAEWNAAGHLIESTCTYLDALEYTGEDDD